MSGYYFQSHIINNLFFQPTAEVKKDAPRKAAPTESINDANIKKIKKKEVEQKVRVLFSCNLFFIFTKH